MKLNALTIQQCEQVRLWRNEALETLRTPYPLTEEMQKIFYEDVVCDRNSPHRYWAIELDKEPADLSNGLNQSWFVGMGGITYIQWENSIGEISLIIKPDTRCGGIGKNAVDLLLDKAFNYLNLHTIFGEVYKSNVQGVKFWQSITAKYNGFTTALPNRKFWNGEFHYSLYFSIDRDDFNGK